MPRKILVASLGEAPAVVTETINKIEEEERIQFDEVITISTSGSATRESIDMLCKEIAEHYTKRITYIPDYIKALDIDTEEDNLDFMKKVCEWLKRYKKDDVYISLAGGRKTMSAIMVLAAQIYGARMLCHVIAEPYTESQGNIETLERLTPEERKNIFHPKSEDVILVRLPFISLFPMIGLFIDALKGQEIGKDSSDDLAFRILEDNHLIEKKEGKVTPTFLGKRLLSILEDVESLPVPSPLRPDEKKVTIHDHGYGGKIKQVEAFAKRFTQSPYVTSVETISYGHSPRGGIRQIHNDGQIDIDYPTREWSAGLKIKTTATTRAQTERMSREIEKYL